MMKKTGLENKTDRLWQGYDENLENEFWLKYEKLIHKAKNKKEAITVSTDKLAPAIIDKKAPNVFHSRYYLHGLKNKLFIAAEVTGFGLFWTLAPTEWVIWGTVMLFFENLGKFVAQRGLINFRIVDHGIIIHNKQARLNTGHRWDNMASVELIRENRKYYLKITTYDSREYKYRYTLSKEAHEAFFVRLAEKTEVFQLIDYL